MGDKVEVKQSAGVISGMYLAVIAVLMTDWLVPGVIIPAWIVAVAWMMIWMCVGLILLILAFVILVALLD
jgi:hypothetical protein